MITLHTLPQTKEIRKRRVGRGDGSGRGKNSGKGNKGQTKRAGKRPVGFEGGQNPLIKRSPKYKGFNVRDNHKKAVTVTLGRIDSAFEVKEEVTISSLIQKGVVPDKTKNVRIVNTGKLTKKVTFSDDSHVYLTKGVQAVIK